MFQSKLHSEGIGVSKDSAVVIDVKHKDLFWEKGLLGYSMPKVLQVTVFFYVGLNFVLRGVQEQYDLVPSQFKRIPSDCSIYNDDQYSEYISKNNQHRFKDIDCSNKCVHSYAQPDSDRCIVKLLDEYFKHLPSDASVLYLRPLAKFGTPPNPKPCFSKQRVGISTLKNFVPEISQASGCGVKYTNHSLRATAITCMFNAGMPEKVIADNSGHKSLKGLR